MKAKKRKIARRWKRSGGEATWHKRRDCWDRYREREKMS